MHLQRLQFIQLSVAAIELSGNTEVSDDGDQHPNSAQEEFEELIHNEYSEELELTETTYRTKVSTSNLLFLKFRNILNMCNSLSSINKMIM